MATATIAEQVEELESELESLYAQVGEALKALDNGDTDRASEILNDLLDEGEETEDTD